MKTIIRNISYLITPLPYGMWKEYRRYFVMSVIYAALATSFIASNSRLFVITVYSFSLLLFIKGVNKKKSVIKAGCKKIVLRVSEYTYISKKKVEKEKPTGMLLTSVRDADCDKKLIVLLQSKNIPKIGSIVHIFIPGNATAVRYGDKYYFPIVYDYVEEQTT